MLLVALADTFRLLREPGFRRLGLISICLSFALLVAALAIALMCFDWLQSGAGMQVSPLYDTGPIFGEDGPQLRDMIGLEGFAVLMVTSMGLMMPVAAVFGALSMDVIARRIEALRWSWTAMPASATPPARLKDSVNFTGLLIAANILTIILMLFLSTVMGAAVLLLWYAVNGWLLGREYFTLVAQRHLGLPEVARLRGAARGRIWLAGCLMALPLSVPVINLALPFLGAAWFTLIFHRLRA